MDLVRRVLGSWWFRGGAIALVLVIGGGIAGWWFLIRDDAELATTAPDPRSFSSATATTAAANGGASPAATSSATAAATSPPAAGTTKYTVDSANSSASYFAGETLASIGIPSTAEGKTQPVTGEFYLTSSGLDASQTSSFTVDLRNFKSNESRRDSRVQQALETSRFPTATFVVKRIENFPATFRKPRIRPCR